MIDKSQLPQRPTSKIRVWSEAAFIAVLIAFLSFLPATAPLRAQPLPSDRLQPNAQPRDQLEAAWIDPQVGQSLPLDAQFKTYDNRPVRLREVLGQRPVVLCLVYFECPMLCKLAADGVMRAVSSMSEQVGQDFDVAFISFDPRDTPARASAAREHALKQYTRSGAKHGLHFLTGPQASIDAVTHAVGFHYAWDSSTEQFSHATGLMIVAPDGVVTEYLDGVNFSPNSLAAAVGRARRNELTQSQSFSFVRCYLYDPITGKFGAAVQWTIRVLAAATVVTIGAAIVRMNRLSKNSEVVNSGDAHARGGPAEVQDA